MGDTLIWFALPLLVLLVALVVLDRRRTPSPVSTMRVVSALALVAALATTVQVVRIGDSGARAAWQDKITSSNGE